jgi:hypothetical protein
LANPRLTQKIPWPFGARDSKINKKEEIMSKKPKTHVAIILDRSGSMQSIRSQALQNYNEQIQQMKENAKDQDIFCSLITFNGEVYEHLWDQPADALEEADESAYVPAGGTAMYDAVGYAVKKLKDTVPADDNTAFLIVVISDGEENASKHFGIPASLNEHDLRLFSASGRSDLKVLIENCQNTKQWTFTYMGCDERYLYKVAQTTGIPISNMAAFSTKSAESASFGFNESRQRHRSYYNARKLGKIETSCLYSDDAKSAASFIPPDEVEKSPPIFDPNQMLTITGIDCQTWNGQPDVPVLPAVDSQVYTQNALAAMKDYSSIPVRQQPFGSTSKIEHRVRGGKFDAVKAVNWKA